MIKTTETMLWVLAVVASVQMVFFTGPTLEARIAFWITAIPALLLSSYLWISKKNKEVKIK